MNASQEEALYDFLDNVSGTFEIDEVVSHIKKIDSGRTIQLAMETESFINHRNLAFPAGKKRWLSRRGFFEPLVFVISPTRLELVNGILIPGHRCIPFANPGFLPQEYSFFWQNEQVPFTTTEGAPEDFYPFYSIFGEEYAPQYVARDNSENEIAFNTDPYDDPPSVSIRTLDMRNIYRETSFVPGDRFKVSTLDWKTGIFKLEKVSKDEWSEADLLKWLEAADRGFEKSFDNLGPASCTEEQIAYAYWYGSPDMGKVPAYSLEYFLYEKTIKIETTSYGIETRFWYAGREIPDRTEMDIYDSRPDKTLIEEILNKLKIPVSEYVIQSYVRDFLFRGEKETGNIMERLIPACTGINGREKKFLVDYIDNVLEEFRESYTPFTDKVLGPVRQRAGELLTAVIDLAAQLSRGDIDTGWLPRHTFIILSQILSHTADIMEDLDSDEPPSETELDALDSSLDSMIETYADLKELIEEAIETFRRNKFALIRSGSNYGTVIEKLIQLSIGGIDVWRRIVVPENFNLGELHRIIQTVFGWRNTQSYNFSTEKIRRDSNGSNGNVLDPNTKIQKLYDLGIIELLYEYGAKWTIRIMILSQVESPASKPVRCVAGAGAAPPEFIGGPIKFRKVLSALESENDMERLNARQELGPEFIQGEFNLDSCNRNLNVLYFKGYDTDR